MISKTIGFRGLAYFQTHPNAMEILDNSSEILENTMEILWTYGNTRKQLTIFSYDIYGSYGENTMEIRDNTTTTIIFMVFP